VTAIGGVTGVDMEHRNQPPYKEVNSGGGTKLVQLTHTACKCFILRGIEWWPETGLGLLIAKRAIQLHYGTISAEHANPGLQVTMSFPIFKN
jgi:signal transduction histidine kinase